MYRLQPMQRRSDGKLKWRSDGHGVVRDARSAKLIDPVATQHYTAHLFLDNCAREQAEREAQAADARALELLRKELEPEQRWELACHGHFHARGASGRWWRINDQPWDNLHEVDETRALTQREWCVAIHDALDPDDPMGYVPAGDRMLALLLAVSNEELERELVDADEPIANLTEDRRELLKQAFSVIRPNGRVPGEGEPIPEARVILPADARRTGFRYPPVMLVEGGRSVEHEWVFVSDMYHREALSADSIRFTFTVTANTANTVTFHTLPS